MKRSALLIAMLSLGLTWPALAEDKHEHKHELPPQAPTNATFEKMKGLVGEWVLADEKGKPTDKVVSIIRLTAGGSAIHETVFPGEPMEMVSVYTADGPDLLMTHYCVLGNQPRMKAKANPSGNRLNFEFAGGSNLDPKKDMHMHSAVLTIVDPDHFEVEGVAWDQGKPAAETCGKMTYLRKK
ncbi:hypothetical protein [Planctomicrobium sp. SH664]|uniref:hypothetical protein n=1 Tax=Planctomicrobium sp. SH664 TaxID=3448125 RepID=UPI003F5C4BAC